MDPWHLLFEPSQWLQPTTHRGSLSLWEVHAGPGIYSVVGEHYRLASELVSMISYKRWTYASGLTTGTRSPYAIEQIAPALYRPIPGMLASMSFALSGSLPSYISTAF